MKKLILIVALAAFVLGTNTACNVDADFSGAYVVNNIFVDPDEWKEMWFTRPDGTRFIDYIYADRSINELTSDVLTNGVVDVFFKFLSPDNNGNETIPAHEPLPMHVYVTETLSYNMTYEVSERNLRLKVYVSDGKPYYPFDKTMYFKLAIVR